MAGTVAYIDGAAGTGAIVDVSAVKPLPMTAAGDSYAHITTSTTTTVKAAPGTLKAVSINTKGTVASTTTLKDDTTTLAVIDSLNLSGTWTFNIACATSIVCVTTGSSPPDVTVTYR